MGKAKEIVGTEPLLEHLSGAAARARETLVLAQFPSCCSDGTPLPCRKKRYTPSTRQRVPSLQKKIPARLYRQRELLMDYDVTIVGGGPAGASCAAFCAMAGLRVLVLERAAFPRDKVCGDCLNPDAWPVLVRLGVEDAVRSLPHAALRTVEFAGLRGQPIRLPLPDVERGEIAVKRRDLDALLLANASARGAAVGHESAVSGLRRVEGGHALDLADAGSRGGMDAVTSRFLVAADGRQLGRCGIHRPARRDEHSRRTRETGAAHRPASARAVSPGVWSEGADALVSAGIRRAVPGWGRGAERVPRGSAGNAREPRAVGAGRVFARDRSSLAHDRAAGSFSGASARHRSTAGCIWSATRRAWSSRSRARGSITRCVPASWPVRRSPPPRLASKARLRQRGVMSRRTRKCTAGGSGSTAWLARRAGIPGWRVGRSKGCDGSRCCFVI